MTVQPGDVVRVTAVMDFDKEGTVQNVFWVLQSGGDAADGSFMTAINTKLNTAYGYFDDLMPDGLTFQEIRGYNITQAQPLPTQSWATLTTGGVDQADALPSVVSLLALLRTGYNRINARKFFAPFTEANFGDAEWSTTLVAAANNFLSGLLASYSSGNGSAEVGVWSTKLLQWLPIAEWVVGVVPAYQRRRRKGRGS
jgi:hypothetical protein